MKKIVFFVSSVIALTDANGIEQSDNPFGKNHQLRKNSITVTTPMSKSVTFESYPLKQRNR